MRKRFFINGKPVAGSGLHARYLRPAHVLLDALRQRMQMGNLQQLAQRYVTEDGATITALSRFGQDEIRIDVPQRHEVTVQHAKTTQETTTAFREFCTWLPDRFTYSDVIATGGNATAALTSGGPYIYYGIADPGDYELRQVIALDANTLKEVKRFSTTIRTGPARSWAMTLALEPNRFTWGGNDFGGTQDTFLEQWDFGAEAVSAFNCAALNTFGVSAASFEVRASISQSLTVKPFHVIPLGYSDETDPWESHNAWSVIDTTDNTTVLQLVDPEWGRLEYLTTLAHIAPGGDVFFIHTPTSTERTTAGVRAALYRHGTGTSGITQTYPLPEQVDSYFHGTSVNASIAVLNDDRTIYLRVKDEFGIADTLYLWDGTQWQVISTATPVVSMPGWTRGLAHDPAKDVVAAFDGDGSGAWIFNGKDCFGAVMPPFYVAFDGHPELLHNPTSELACESFHDGTLYMQFFNGDDMVIGKIEIGRLSQIKITEPVA